MGEILGFSKKHLQIDRFRRGLAVSQIHGFCGGFSGFRQELEFLGDGEEPVPAPTSSPLQAVASAFAPCRPGHQWSDTGSQPWRARQSRIASSIR